MTIYSPFVYWAQNEQNIFLKIDLKDVKEPKINLEKKRLYFFSKGVGARGLQDYSFTIDFNGDIDVKECIHKITDNRIEFTLKKKEKNWWPKLLGQNQKPIWLKIDHDRFQSEDMDDDGDDDDDDDIRNSLGDIHRQYPNLYNKLQKEEFGYRKEDFKMVYLTLYNLIMYVGFMYVVCVLSVRYLRDGIESFPTTYEAVGPAMCFLQLLQCLEILHPLFGYVKGGVLVPFLQILGRNFVLILMLEYEPRLQVMPVVFYLFMTWSAIEIIRYPYYMSQLFKKQNPLLTWLRYSAWIVLYPIGFICESVIIFRNLIFIDESGKWSFSLTYPIEFTFKFSYVLRFYLLFLLIPCGYLLMSHMYTARKQRLGPKRSKKKKNK